PPAAPRARAIAFLFDDLNTLPSQQGDLARARAAAAAYLANHGASAPAGDTAAIFSTSGATSLDFTSDRTRLLAALHTLAPRSHAAPLGCPLISPYQAYEIANQLDPDALSLAVAQALHPGCSCSGLTVDRCTPLVRSAAESYLSLSEEQSQQTLDALQDAVEALSRQPGDRLLLLASSGFISPDLQAQISRTVDRALRAGVVINALDAKGLDAPTAHNTPDDPPVASANLNSWRDATASAARDQLNASLAQVAEGTGGSLLQNTNDLPGAVRQLAQAPAVSYLLGFAPAGVAADGSLHRLTVKVAGHADYRIQARRGYLAPPKPGSVLDLQERLNQAALAGDARHEIPVHVGLDERAPTGDGDSRVLHVVVTVDPRGLPFVSAEKRNLEQLSFVAVLSDDHGAFVAGQQGEMNLRLTDASRKALSQPGAGLHAGISLAAPPGHYRLRVVVEESVKGRLSAATTGLTLH
ncbi:MAG: VWA domain-containing protein, partial [Terriglobales bacterium]